MKKTFSKTAGKWMPLLILLLMISCKNNPSGNKAPGQALPDSTAYDAKLAESYGADDYGMKKYIFAFLYRGENRTADSARAMELQMAHLENIRRMAEEGKLVLAGPFFGNDTLRGIYIFNVPTLEEAEALTNSDPAIQAGVLRMELKEWYGAAALMAVNELNERVTRKPITE